MRASSKVTGLGGGGGGATLTGFFDFEDLEATGGVCS